MKRMKRRVCIAFALVCAASGCTSEQLYGAGQGWQRNECNRVLDQGDRERCLERANVSQGEYQRQSGVGRGP